MPTENPVATPLGEDCDLWIVTGTTDAHSADEAVRQWVEEFCGETIESMLDADDLVEFDISHRDDWAWKPGGNPGDPMDEAILVHGQESRKLPHFSGYYIQA